MRIVALLVIFALLCCSEGHKQEDCLNIPVPMMRKLINTSRGIQNSLLQDDKRSLDLLRKVKKCYKKLTIPDFKHILEIYDEHVFQKLWGNNSLQLPVEFMNSFDRLKNIIEGCATEGRQTPSLCAREDIKSLRKTFAKLKPDGRLKALSEFHTVLVWIGLMDNRNTHRAIH